MPSRDESIESPLSPIEDVLIRANYNRKYIRPHGMTKPYSTERARRTHLGLRVNTSRDLSVLRLVFQPTNIRITNAAEVFEKCTSPEGDLSFKSIQNYKVDVLDPSDSVRIILAKSLENSRSTLISFNFRAIETHEKMATVLAITALQKYLRSFKRLHEVRIELNLILEHIGLRKYQPKITELPALLTVLFGNSYRY